MLKILTTLLLSFTTINSLTAQVRYGNRTYYSRVCSSPNCKMCNTIQRQLNRQYSSQPVQKIPSSTTVKATPKILLEKPGTPKKVAIPEKKATELVPTPQDAIDALVKYLALDSSDILIEPGCGDARLLSEVRVCPTIGIELNSKTAVLARKNAPHAIIIEGDATQFNYEKATVVYMYLYPEVMKKVVNKLPSRVKIVSYLHEIPGVIRSQQKITLGEHIFYIGST